MSAITAAKAVTKYAGPMSTMIPKFIVIAIAVAIVLIVLYFYSKKKH